ncbi:hypothetical protein Cgig2_005464 [Carnegiea gigantea]|uniref:Glycosyl transferase family 1 domain-containing protein n=1 Tax=Carnegiea gigantea TaxID=171969 RepID=A0A9Q1KDB1_9CARY|nr:hypothetical protein Cgig2_005464 [Carnegiea gigantea]
MNAQKNSTQRRPRTSCKSLTIYALPVLAVFLAVLFNLNKSDVYKTQYLRLNFSPPNTNFFSKVFLNSLRRRDYDEIRDTQKFVSSPKPHFCVLWMAPFLSGGGYSSEAWSYITAIQHNAKNPSFRLGIEQHGDLVSIAFWEGLPEYKRKMAFELHETQCNMNETVVVCHSEPGAWYPPLFDALPCPPSANYGDFLAVIGRTMFETDRVNHEHVKRCNRMDYVWVPTEFHVSTFVKSGVEASKVVKVVQSVDVDFFDPFKYQSLDLVPLRELVLGKKLKTMGSEKEFVFLSIFKWEYRKGWDVLLRAYLQEFSGADAVALYLLTNAFHTDNDFSNKILEFVEDSGIERPISGWARVYVIDKHIPEVDLPRLYKAANGFVLPSRGEGWGRPLVEAMSMSLPVIATSWSGPTEYLTEENGYPLPVGKMSEVRQGPFKGHLWAEPSVDKLQGLMRHVMTNAEEARVKGMQAREDMICRFSPKNVAEISSCSQGLHLR